MSPSVVSFIWPYLAAAVISFSVALFALRWRALPGARAFAILTLAEAIWAGAYLVQHFYADLSSQLLWNNIQFSAVLVSVLGYLSFAFSYTRRKLRHPGLLWSLLVLLALLIAGLVWSDSTFHLFRTRPHLELDVPFYKLVFQDGPAFPLFTLFVYGSIAFSTFLLASNFFTSPSIYRVQIGTVLIGVFVPWVVSLLSFTGLISIPLHDITPLAFAPSNLLMLWALFRYHLFEVAPIARDTLVERMRDGVIVLDRRKRIIDFNPAAREILNLSNTRTPGAFIARTAPILHQFVVHLTESPNARAEIAIDVLGMPSRYEVGATPLYDNLGSLTGYLVLLRDVTEQKRSEERLHQMALTDYLTGVLNRRAFFELASPELERARRYHHALAFILMDVDNFKKVNDTYGHLVGDKVLVEMARICQRNLREADRLARFGGEEFIVMLPETDLDGARQTAERLRKVVDCSAVNTRQGSVRITISLGVVMFDPADELMTLDRLLGQADQALYQAKRAGRNQVRIYQSEQVPFEG